MNMCSGAQLSCLILSNCGLKLRPYFPPTNQNLNTLYTRCSYVLDHQLEFHCIYIYIQTDRGWFPHQTSSLVSLTTLKSTVHMLQRAPPLRLVWQTIVQAELMIIATCLIAGLWWKNSERQITYNCGWTHRALWGTHLLPSKNTRRRVSVYRLLLTSLF